MKRFFHVVCLVLIPLTAIAQDSEEKAELPDLAADALAEKAGGANRIRGVELSKPFGSGGKSAMCATSNAHDGNGNFIGLTYWQIEFNEDGTEVKSVRNVTGLNSNCYSERYKTYKN